MRPKSRDASSSIPRQTSFFSVQPKDNGSPSCPVMWARFLPPVNSGVRSMGNREALYFPESRAIRICISVRWGHHFCKAARRRTFHRNRERVLLLSPAGVGSGFYYVSRNLVIHRFAASGERHPFIIADNRRNARNSFTTFSRLRNHAYSVSRLDAVPRRLRDYIRSSLELVRHPSDLLHASKGKSPLMIEPSHEFKEFVLPSRKERLWTQIMRDH